MRIGYLGMVITWLKRMQKEPELTPEEHQEKEKSKTKMRNHEEEVKARRRRERRQHVLIVRKR